MTYTNSPLVCYTLLSPNHSGKRRHAIDRISPHCVVGQCTAETLGGWFSRSSNGASSNYGIDRDGRVGLYVEEKNCSWCTSSNPNDQRAVTIECASDTRNPYTMNGAVYDTLIKLCADICRRNGKRKLLWLADREKTLSYEPAEDEMVLTVHRWFANKSCPGEWLYSRLGDLAQRVTVALGEQAESPAPAVSPAEAEGTENVVDTEKTVWDYLYGKIGNAFGAAGMMGNLYAESGLNPENLQNSFSASLGLTDSEYTAAVDDGSYTDFVHDSAGYGLAQWTFWSRKQTLLDFARMEEKSIGDLSLQLDFLWMELSESFSDLLSALHSATSVADASAAVLTQFERPADVGESVQEGRAGFGEMFYEKYAPPAFPTPPFFIRVKVDDLGIRTGPGADFSLTGRCTGVGVFTIVEVNPGQGAVLGWGRLKSGAGWISLDDCDVLK